MKQVKKTVLLSLSILSLLSLQSFRLEKTNLNNQEVKQSNIEWKAYKVTGSHKGNVSLKSGSLAFENEKLVGGSFIMDMTSITCTDLDGEYKNKLEGHLKSDDFFGVSKYATSTLELVSVKSVGKNVYDVKGKLTIKQITKPISFKVSVYGKKANASIKVDRTDFDIKYGSGSYFDDLADNLIYDEFDLIVDLVF
jgi:polyisoprenoid-binding protein YceI